MSGALSLWLLSLSREQRESDSPCRAKPVGSDNRDMTIGGRPRFLDVNGLKSWSVPYCSLFATLKNKSVPFFHVSPFSMGALEQSRALSALSDLEKCGLSPISCPLFLAD